MGTAFGVATDTATTPCRLVAGAKDATVIDREGYRALCLAPPRLGNWRSADLPQLERAFEALGIRCGILPNLSPAFCGRVSEAGEKSSITRLGSSRLLQRLTDSCEGEWLHHKLDALVVPLGGCMLIAATAIDRGGVRRLLASHAGLESLVDLGRVAGNPPRGYEGVVYAIAAAFKTRYGIPSQEVKIECFFGLAPDSLKYHYVYEGKHRKHYARLYAYLEKRWPGTAYKGADEDGEFVVPDPGAIFLAQARHLFKSATRSSNISTDGPYASTRHVEPALAGKRRNLGVILRTH